MRPEMSRKASLIRRSLSVLLSLGLVFPSPAWGLRPLQSAHNGGLEEEIAQDLGRPAGLEETVYETLSKPDQIDDLIGLYARVYLPGIGMQRYRAERLEGEDYPEVRRALSAFLEQKDPETGLRTPEGVGQIAAVVLALGADRRPIGYVYAYSADFREGKSVLELNSAVDRDQQGRGIGTRLKLELLKRVVPLSWVREVTIRDASIGNRNRSLVDRLGFEFVPAVGVERFAAGRGVRRYRLDLGEPSRRQKARQRVERALTEAAGLEEVETLWSGGLPLAAAAFLEQVRHGQDHRFAWPIRHEGRPVAYVAGVADGFGRDGELASRLAGEEIHRFLTQPEQSSQLAHLTPETAEEVLRRLATAAVGKAHQALSDKFWSSTVALVLLAGSAAAVVTAGDSRVYLIRDGRLSLLTLDRNMAALAAAAKEGWDGKSELSSDRLMRIARAARNEEGQHIMVSYLGMDGPLQMHTVSLPLQAADRFLLVSDGVTKPISEEALESWARESAGGDIPQALEALRAQAQPGTDDRAAVLVGVERVPVSPLPALPAPPGGPSTAPTAGMEERVTKEAVDEVGRSLSSGNRNAAEEAAERVRNWFMPQEAGNPSSALALRNVETVSLLAPVIAQGISSGQEWRRSLSLNLAAYLADLEEARSELVKAWGAVLEGLNSQEGWTRLSAAGAVKSFLENGMASGDGDLQGKAALALSERLEDEDPQVRHSVAEALGAFGSGRRGWEPGALKDAVARLIEHLDTRPVNGAAAVPESRKRAAVAAGTVLERWVQGKADLPTLAAAVLKLGEMLREIGQQGPPSFAPGVSEATRTGWRVRQLLQAMVHPGAVTELTMLGFVAAGARDLPVRDFLRRIHQQMLIPDVVDQTLSLPSPEENRPDGSTRLSKIVDEIVEDYRRAQNEDSLLVPQSSSDVTFSLKEESASALGLSPEAVYLENIPLRNGWDLLAYLETRPLNSKKKRVFSREPAGFTLGLARKIQTGEAELVRRIVQEDRWEPIELDDPFEENVFLAIRPKDASSERAQRGAPAGPAQTGLEEPPEKAGERPAVSEAQRSMAAEGPVSSFRDLLRRVEWGRLLQNARGAAAIDLTREGPDAAALRRAAAEAGYSRVLLVRSSSPSARSIRRPVKLFVQPVWKETVRSNLAAAEQAGQITFTSDLEEAELVIADWTLVPLRHQAKLQVDARTTVRYVTPFFLAELQTQDLLRPGKVLVVDRLVQGDFGKALLIFV